MRGYTVRRQVLILAGVALAVAVGAVLWYVFTQRHLSAILAEDARTNVLLISHDGSGVVESLSLISVTAEDLALFSIPTDLLLKESEGDLVAAGAVYVRSGGLATAQRTGELLGIGIPYYVAADRAAVTAWIDDLGGITIGVDETAIYVDESVEPPLRMEIRAGSQRMAGAEAVAFAVSPAEPGGSARTTRQLAVLRALIETGIRSPSQRSVRTRLRELHPALDTNCVLADLQDLAAILRGVSEERIQTTVVPTSTVVIDGVPWKQPMIVETERLVASTIKGFDLLTPEDVRIAVFNGNGVRQMASRTAEYLRARGFIVSRIANADAFDYPTSYIIVLSTEAKAWILSDALISDVQIVFPDSFAEHYEALEDFIPSNTDLVFIAGAGMELE